MHIMIKKIVYKSFIIGFVVFWVTGFILTDNNHPLTKFHSEQKITHDPVPYTSQNIVYTDNFDGANDTTSLKVRGYKVWYRGTGPQAFDTWFVFCVSFSFILSHAHWQYATIFLITISMLTRSLFRSHRSKAARWFTRDI